MMPLAKNLPQDMAFSMAQPGHTGRYDRIILNAAGKAGGFGEITK